MTNNEDDNFEINEKKISDVEKKALEEFLITREAEFNKDPLFCQTIQIFDLLQVLISNNKAVNYLEKNCLSILFDSILLIKSKLYFALLSNNYFVCIKNAYSTRERAEYMLLTSLDLNNLKDFDETKISAFRNEMEKFKELFKIWATEIKQMDKKGLEDEWRLY